MTARRAIVVGGGIAGLSAGIALQKAGYSVGLYEEAEQIAPRGAALSIWGNAMAGLDWLGCGRAVRAAAAPITGLRLCDRRDRLLFGPAGVGDTDSYLPLRATLQAILLDALVGANMHLGTGISGAIDNGDRVRIIDESGSTIDEADLLVVANGIGSEIATRLLGNPPVYAGYGGVLALADSMPSNPGLAEELWGTGDRFGLFDTGSGTYWFYMASGAEAEVSALDHAAVLARSAAFPDRVREAVAATRPDALIPVAIHSRPMPRTFGRGRIVCIGDAAHAMEPNQGQGGCQGIEDAWALGVLAQRLPAHAILPDFDRMRLKRAARPHRDSALIGSLAHGSTFVRRIADPIMRAIPRSMDAAQIRRRIAAPDYS